MELIFNKYLRYNEISFIKEIYITRLEEKHLQEKRKYKRLPVQLELQISSLFKQNNVSVENIDAPITVVNVSKSGIGFLSASNLPLGYYFNACIRLGREDAKLYCVVKIIRSEAQEDEVKIYGCEFIGMAPVLSYIFDEFEQSLE